MTKTKSYKLKSNNAVRLRDRRSRKILQQLAREMNIPFSDFLDGVEDETISIAAFSRVANESPEVE